MAHMQTEQAIALDLRKELSCYFVIKIDVVRNWGSGRRLITEWSDDASGQSIGLGLDMSTKVCAWLRDQTGATHKLSGIDAAEFKSWGLLAFEIQLLENDAVRLSLAATGGAPIVCEVPTAMASTGRYRQTIGANARGQEPSYFSIVEWGIVSSASEAEKTFIRNSLIQKYGLARSEAVMATARNRVES